LAGDVSIEDKMASSPPDPPHLPEVKVSSSDLLARALANTAGIGIDSLRAEVARRPDACEVWLELAGLYEQQGNDGAALHARFEAVTRAQRRGLWHGADSTPAALFDDVVHAIEQVRTRRREIYFGAIDSVRAEYGGCDLGRIERALSAHLREWKHTTADPTQRSRFFHIPDLPAQPWLDPMLQPWAPRLRDAFEQVRQEAFAVLREDSGLEPFVKVKPGDTIANYLGGSQPAWNALFFYRHGRRYDGNHARCPTTSSLLESIDLCRIAGHAPEICFSVLTAGTHILPHHGVTNARVVMHLPLLVPPDCALKLTGHGERVWREGELLMFDDTFEHEAWNRSAQPRVVLLMDCWNPHLSAPERLAVTRLIETIAALHLAARGAEAQ
jgi:aspartate beta-hydroxylase